MFYKLIRSVKSVWARGKHTGPEAAAEHGNTKSNLLDVLAQALHNFRLALNVGWLQQQHPGRKLTHLLGLFPLPRVWWV